MTANSSAPLFTRRCRYRSLLVTLVTAIALAGCATKPWRSTPLGPEASRPVDQTLQAIRQHEQQRGNCIDADARLFFTSRIRDQALSGYVMMLKPDSLKFVSTNPFGQPLFAFVTNGKRAQYVNTIQQTYGEGTVQTLAQQYNLPFTLMPSPWLHLITGSLPATDTIKGIRPDSAGRGVWVSFGQAAENPANTTSKELYDNILIQQGQPVIKERLLTSKDTRSQLKMRYEEWTGDSPLLPGTITISGLDYGGELRIEFDRVAAVERCNVSDFTLSRPRGFQYLLLD